MARSKYKTAKEYMSELDQDQIQKLYELYLPDFEIFGYSPDEYFKLTSGGGRKKEKEKKIIDV